MVNWIFSNLRIFFLALSLAVAVWISAVTAADPDEVRLYPRPVPIEMIGQDPRLVSVGSLSGPLSITLRAPRSTWETLNASDGQVRAILDLSGLQAGQHHLTVQLQVNTQPVRVVSLTPQKVDVTLETLATRTIPVQVALRGEPAVGYAAGATSIHPAQVTISGPQSWVERVASISADLNIAGVRQDVQTTLPLRMLAADGSVVNGLTLDPENAQVFIPITQQGGYREIAVKVNVRGQVAGGYRLTNVSVLPPVLTVYSKNPALVNDLPGFVETEPLNLNGASQDIDLRLTLVLPQGVTPVGDQTVRVQVGVATIEGSLSLGDVPIEVLGLAPGMEATISPATLDVILTGPLPMLDKLTLKDVRFLVDLTGLPAGTHQVVPQAENLFAELQVQSLNPATVEVNIHPADTTTATPNP
jgi:YbbR domain-containing protein